MRLYAEDTANNFLPATGEILLWATGGSEEVRYDTGVATGSTISIYYDPMLAKIIAHGPNRMAAIRKLRHALEQLTVLGITCNRDFLIQILQHPDFQAGNFDTHFLSRTSLAEQPFVLADDQLHHFAIAAFLQQWNKRRGAQTQLQTLPSGWRNVFYQAPMEVFQWKDEEVEVRYQKLNDENNFVMQIKEHRYNLRLIEMETNRLVCEINELRLPFAIAETETAVWLHQLGGATVVLEKVSPFPTVAAEAVTGGYLSPMPGEVVRVLVAVGDTVRVGQGLLVISSMKMETTIEAFEAGVVEEVYVGEKMFVEAGVLLVKLASQSASQSASQ